MGYKHTMDYYSALKRKEVLSQATVEVSLEDIMLNAISQPQKNKYCVIPLCEARGVKFIETESRRVVARGRREGEWGAL